AGLLFVIDDKYSESIQNGLISARSTGRAAQYFISVRKRRDRKHYGKHRTAPFSVALRVNGPPVQFHQLADDRQAQSEPAVSSRARTVRLSKSVKDVGQELRLDSDARVSDSDLREGVERFQGNINAAPSWRELHCV